MGSDWATVALGGAGLFTTASVAVWAQMQQNRARREQYEREDSKELTRMAAEVLGSVQIFLVDLDPQRIVVNASEELYERLEKTEYYWNGGPRIRIHNLAVSDPSSEIRETAARLGAAANNMLSVDRWLLGDVLKRADPRTALDEAMREHQFAGALADHLGALLRKETVGAIPTRSESD